MFDCYLADSTLRPTMFSFLEGAFRELQQQQQQQPQPQQQKADGPAAIAEQLRKSVLKNISAVVTTDSGLAAKLVIDHFSRDHHTVLKHLEAQPELQFQYLKAMVARENELSKDQRSAVDAAPTTSSAAAGNPAMAVLQQQQQMQQQSAVNADIHEMYLRLMCRYAPQEVYHYLTAHSDYNIEHMLALCRQYKIASGEAYLLERTGLRLFCLLLSRVGCNSTVMFSAQAMFMVRWP